MWQWIVNMWEGVFGRISDTIRNWVRDLINGVYGFYHYIDSLIRAAWYDLANATYWFVRNFQSFAYWVYAKLWQIIRSAIPAIINEYRRLYNDVVQYAESVYNQAASWFYSALHYADNLIAGVLKWVRDNIWTPLYNLTTSLFDWVKNKGELIWYYITHPDALAELLFGGLITIFEREAFAVADRLGKFLIALIVKNLQQFTMLIEDILSAIL